MNDFTKTKLDNIRTEYTALRTEIRDTDRTCLLLLGYLIAAVGLLFKNKVGWVASCLSFFSLGYFTEKRFVILKIGAYIRTKIEAEGYLGFYWETLLNHAILRSTICK